MTPPMSRSSFPRRRQRAVIRSLSIGAAAGVLLSGPSAGAQTYHFSTAGDDGAPGTSAEPKATLQHATDLLAPGVTIRLSRGDVWYVGRVGWPIADKQGTASEPIAIEAYGTGALPVVANLDLLSSAWTDEGSNRWSHPIPGGGDEIQRCFVSGEGRRPVPLGELDDPLEYAVASGRIYLYATSDPAGLGPIEVSISYPVLRLENVAHLTFRDIAFHGGTWAGVALVPPTDHVTIDQCEVRRSGSYGIRLMPPADTADLHANPTITDSLIDKDWTVHENVAGEEPGGDGITLNTAVAGGLVRGNRVVDFGHTSIQLSAPTAAAHGVHNVVVELNETWAETSSYLRGFETMGLPDKCTGNVVRRNLFRDLRQKSKAMGTGNEIYSNVFVVIRESDTTKATGGHLDVTGAWGGIESRDNVVVHNTFVDSDTSSIEGYLHADGIGGQNVIRNNLFVSYGQAETAYGIALTSESGTTTPDQVVAHNCFWNGDGAAAAIRIGGSFYPADEANQQLGTYDGNLQADPSFVDAAQRDFRLTESSPCKELGEPVTDMGPGFVDYLGHEFDPVHPSAGAFQYRELPTCDEAGGACCAADESCAGGSAVEASDCATCCAGGTCEETGKGGAGQGGSASGATGAGASDAAPEASGGCDCAWVGAGAARSESTPRCGLLAVLLGLVRRRRPRG